MKKFVICFGLLLGFCLVMPQVGVAQTMKVGQAPRMPNLAKPNSLTTKVAAQTYQNSAGESSSQVSTDVAKRVLTEAAPKMGYSFGQAWVLYLQGQITITHVGGVVFVATEGGQTLIFIDESTFLH